LKFDKNRQHGKLALIPEKIEVVYNLVQNGHKGLPDAATGIPLHAAEGACAVQAMLWHDGIWPIAIDKSPVGHLIINAQHVPTRPGWAIPISNAQKGEAYALDSLHLMAERIKEESYQ
jgi:hypothetical protein